VGARGKWWVLEARVMDPVNISAEATYTSAYAILYPEMKFGMDNKIKKL